MAYVRPPPPGLNPGASAAAYQRGLRHEAARASGFKGKFGTPASAEYMQQNFAPPGQPMNASQAAAMQGLEHARAREAGFTGQFRSPEGQAYLQQMQIGRNPYQLQQQLQQQQAAQDQAAQGQTVQTQVEPGATSIDQTQQQQRGVDPNAVVVGDPNAQAAVANQTRQPRWQKSFVNMAQRQAAQPQAVQPQGAYMRVGPGQYRAPNGAIVNSAVNPSGLMGQPPAIRRNYV